MSSLPLLTLHHRPLRHGELPAMTEEAASDDLRRADVPHIHPDPLRARLREVQESIRLLDPSDDSTEERELRDPTVCELITTDYRALRTLRLRQTLLRQSIRLTSHRPGS